MLCSVLVGGAVLRVAGGVFYGLGDPPGEDPEMAQESSEETSETAQGKQRTPLTMIVPAAVLVVAALGVALLPGTRCGGRGARPSVRGPARLQRRPCCPARTSPTRRAAPAEPAGVTVTAVATGAGSAAGRRCPRLPRAVLAAAARCCAGDSSRAPGWPRSLRRFQSGVVNDYVTWIVIGLACLGGALALAIR